VIGSIQTLLRLTAQPARHATFIADSAASNLPGKLHSFETFGSMFPTGGVQQMRRLNESWWRPNMRANSKQMKKSVSGTSSVFAERSASALPSDWDATTPCCGLKPDRRTILRLMVGVSLASLSVNLGVPEVAGAVALTKEQRDKLTPDQVIEQLKLGNERFRTGKMQAHDYLAQKRATAGGQFPAAAILSCIDSRAPAEIILDVGIGDTFNARVAGNIANDDLIGSLEFACAAAGAKVILVMGHTACGAIKGAIDNVALGHLTALLDKIKPAIPATTYTGERTSKNDAFVDAVAATNSRRTADEIRARSSVLAGLEKQGKIKIVASMYHLVGGSVEFLS
jgi:carbonic anhydrase